jgi:ZIP family zinc transporter
MEENIFIAFLLTIFAGLSTGIGSLLTFFGKGRNKSMLSLALGFSAGVMIYISFVELFQRSKDLLIHQYGASEGMLFAVIIFFSGFIIAMLIDFLIPAYENPHEMRSLGNNKNHEEKKLMRLGFLTAVMIGVHNFPEGIAVFASTLTDISIGSSIAFAVAIHNIPEGISIAVPILYATQSKKKAFWYSFSSGLAEPIGALIAFVILLPFFSDMMFGILFGGVAGIMVFVAVDEIIPTSKRYERGHLSIIGLLIGMAVMAFSLMLE